MNNALTWATLVAVLASVCVLNEVGDPALDEVRTSSRTPAGGLDNSAGKHVLVEDEFTSVLQLTVSVETSRP
eukprot:CAMPEP_0171242880 /NCGR_PEP_ID=MMETSP0790-20130122/45966_1 /TAXON_ID=2925 /ORGANISM="Alexandrium catenella, Strain OF101" /LENGTH=71 /DNA_ID=CAMNT_0011709789 /DNA_START=71 /DNA_END=283 /DNA_ORIENTATION=+